MTTEFNFKGKALEIAVFTDNSKSLDITKLDKKLTCLAHVLGAYLFENLKITYYGSLNINFCDGEQIQQLNREYRNKDKVTDVLSFPLHDDIRAGEFDYIGGDFELGDLFVCHEVAFNQAAEFNISFEDEVLHLIVHGFLHLCGYDHELNQKEEELMESQEALLIKNLSLVYKEL